MAFTRSARSIKLDIGIHNARTHPRVIGKYQAYGELVGLERRTTDPYMNVHSVVAYHMDK